MDTPHTNSSDGAEGDVLRQQIRGARGKFAAMASAYFLGSFNDNFFKQAACLLAVAAGKGEMQGYLFAIFTLPFIGLAAPAGWAADRFSKRNVVIAAKCLELAASICGAIGICYSAWPMIMAMVFIMGTQSAFFSPSINGSIPELYPASYVLKANSVLKVVTTTAILIGIATAGECLGAKGTVGGIAMGHVLVGAVVILTAGLGIVVSLGIPKRAAANPTAKFPWAGPVDTVRALLKTRADALLAVTIAMDAFVWFIATLQIPVINEMGIKQFGFDETLTSRLVFAELVGVAVGGVLAGKLAAGSRWFRVLVPAGLGMGAMMMVMLAAPLAGQAMQFWVLAGILVVLGAFGGLLLVPLESFIQVRPAPHEKGQVIAAGNFAAFIGILLAGIVSIPVNKLMVGTTSFAVMGGVMIAGSLVLWNILRKGKWE